MTMMTTNLVLGLLLLLLDKGHGNTLSVVSERKKDAFPKMMEKFETVDANVFALEEKLDIFLNYCPDLTDSTSAPANSRPELDIRWSGGMVSLPCKEGYYQCQTNAVATCKPDTTWEVTGSSDCVDNVFPVQQLTLGTIYNFPCVLPSGGNVTVKGVPTWETRFHVQLWDGNDVIFHASVRFNYHDVRKVKLNTFIKGVWGTPSYASSFPFAVGQEFTFVIKLTSESFQGFVDGTKIFDFADGGRKPNRIDVDVDVQLKDIVIRYP